ncbi:hypothetical protein HYV70_03715 [Candidatus Uhrbacteria bacterium]|nr:hypothetical protein [Candidatus Uhrbacteria bacterium]
MSNRFLALCCLCLLVATTVFAAPPVAMIAVQQDASAVCDLQGPAAVTFTRGLEDCSLSQAKQMYLLFSDTLQDFDVDGDEFSLEIPYDVGVCADRRWIQARTSSGTIYCWNSCECTENGNVCHAECVYI